MRWHNSSASTQRVHGHAQRSASSRSRKKRSSVLRRRRKRRLPRPRLPKRNRPHRQQHNWRRNVLQLPRLPLRRYLSVALRQLCLLAAAPVSPLHPSLQPQNP
jgi:hypothetical protein